MSITTVTFITDTDDMASFEEVCAKANLSPNGALNAFVNYAIAHQEIPFELTADGSANAADKYKPLTLKEVALADEESFILVFNQFLDDFRFSINRAPLIEEEPVWEREPGRWLYTLAATAHKLANDHNLPIPAWALKKEYIAPRPYYAFDTENVEFQAYLRETSQPELRYHNLFYGDNYLSRA